MKGALSGGEAFNIADLWKGGGSQLSQPETAERRFSRVANLG